MPPLVRFLPLSLLVPVVVGLRAAPASAQAIQRCEGPDRRVSYSNEQCPAGTRAVRAVTPATQPSPEAQKEARERAQRERQVAQSLSSSRQAAPRTGQELVPAEDARRAADCAYLRAELDSNRRLRDLLTRRPYYSTEDVEQMDARNATLAADYRRFCSR